MKTRWIWLVLLSSACLVGCEDASPVVQAEGEKSAPESTGDDVNGGPQEGDVQGGEETPQASEPAGGQASSEGFITPSTRDNTGGGGTGLGDLQNANPFKNEPKYDGPSAQYPSGNAPNGNAPSGNAPSGNAGLNNNGSTYTQAGVGSGKKGRSLRNETGIGRMIATPAVSFFATRERMAFNVQLPKALQLYKASNGRGPRSHQEFMSQIIQANRIQLPELPEGQRYVYDPKKEQLMVEHPAGAGN